MDNEDLSDGSAHDFSSRGWLLVEGFEDKLSSPTKEFYSKRGKTLICQISKEGGGVTCHPPAFFLLEVFITDPCLLVAGETLEEAAKGTAEEYSGRFAKMLEQLLAENLLVGGIFQPMTYKVLESNGSAAKIVLALTSYLRGPLDLSFPSATDRRIKEVARKHHVTYAMEDGRPFPIPAK